MVLEPILLHLEGGGHAEDRFPALNHPHPARAEALAVANRFHFKKEGVLGIPGAQEIGVKRVGLKPLHSERGSAERLGQHLPPKDPGTGCPFVLRAKQIAFHGLKLQERK